MGLRDPCNQDVTSDDPPSECLVEMKARDKLITSLLSREEPELFDFERFSSRMAYVLSSPRDKHSTLRTYLDN